MNDQPAPPSPEHLHTANQDNAPCPGCSEKLKQNSNLYVYCIGKLEVRFPSLSIEREFQQRERHLLLQRKGGWVDSGERFFEVLSKNPHLARNVSFIVLVGNIPAYIVVPTGIEVLNSLLSAIRAKNEPEAWNIIIGKRGPMATPTTCGGLIAPLVACDQVYSFTTKEFVNALVTRVKSALGAERQKGEQIATITADVFRRITASTDNLGAQDGHRAINYFLVQHPGLFLAVAERANKAALDSIETRTTEGGMGNRIVTIIFTFVDYNTGVPERLFCRVDVTDEWPFITDIPHGGGAPFGLSPFIETSSHVSDR